MQNLGTQRQLLLGFYAEDLAEYEKFNKEKLFIKKMKGSKVETSSFEHIHYVGVKSLYSEAKAIKIIFTSAHRQHIQILYWFWIEKKEQASSNHLLIGRRSIPVNFTIILIFSRILYVYCFI
jgi:hypothetical protein